LSSLFGKSSLFSNRMWSIDICMPSSRRTLRILSNHPHGRQGGHVGVDKRLATKRTWACNLFEQRYLNYFCMSWTWSIQAVHQGLSTACCICKERYKEGLSWADRGTIPVNELAWPQSSPKPEPGGCLGSWRWSDDQGKPCFVTVFHTHRRASSSEWVYAFSDENCGGLVLSTPNFPTYSVLFLIPSVGVPQGRSKLGLVW